MLRFARRGRAATPVDKNADTHTLAVGGLADQAELLAFATAVEAEPEVEAISLVRADGAIGVFRVRAGSREELIDACLNARGFEVVIEADHNWDVIEVTAQRVAGIADNAAAPTASPTPSTPRTSPRRSALLSDDEVRPRSRLPIFGRPRGQEESEPSAQPVSAFAAPAAASVDAEVLEPVPFDDRAPAAHHEWSAALDEAIEVVLTSDVPAPPSAGPAWPPQVEVDLYQPPITAQPVDLEQLMVIASPLRSFEQVNAFRNRLSELHGVLGLKVGRFYRGALQVTVQYADSVPLADRLHELAEFVPVAMRQSDPGTIEIKLGV